MRSLTLMIVLLAVLLGCGSSSTTGQSATKENIAAITFSQSTRGFNTNLRITKDSLVRVSEGRANTKPNIRRAVTAEEWSSLVESLAKVDLPIIPTLQAPTDKRAHDGAYIGSLDIMSTEGTSYTHSFDDENPHASLMPLMKAILKMTEETK